MPITEKYTNAYINIAINIEKKIDKPVNRKISLYSPNNQNIGTERNIDNNIGTIITPFIEINSSSRK